MNKLTTSCIQIIGCLAIVLAVAFAVFRVEPDEVNNVQVPSEQATAFSQEFRTESEFEGRIKRPDYFRSLANCYEITVEGVDTNGVPNGKIYKLSHGLATKVMGELRRVESYGISYARMAKPTYLLHIRTELENMDFAITKDCLEVAVPAGYTDSESNEWFSTAVGLEAVLREIGEVYNSTQ